MSSKVFVDDVKECQYCRTLVDMTFKIRIPKLNVPLMICRFCYGQFTSAILYPGLGHYFDIKNYKLHYDKYEVVYE